MSADPSDSRLLFARQFVLGPSHVEWLPGWQRLAVTSALYLTVHPDLPVLKVEAEGRSVTLLGYILDPVNPAAGDREIVGRLLGTVSSGGNWATFIAATADLGGRWILIVDDGRRVRLMTDPCGYRQVVFTPEGHGYGVWCASQPGLLAEVLGLEPSPEAMEFIQLYREAGPEWLGAEYWWPGDTTPYDEIRHLLPNHYLDLGRGEATRFWPDRELPPLDLEEVVERNTRLLGGMIRSASARFELALAITGGKDTRLVLAASRPIADRLFYFTLRWGELTEASIDIAIPRRLLRRLGLTHHVIPCAEAMEPWFKRVYMRNVSTAHELYGTMAQALFYEYPRHRVCMKGNGIHVIGVYEEFRKEVQSGVVDVETLLRMAKIPDHPFARRALSRWKAGPRNNADVLSLFYWENREGKWQAMSQLEWDLVQETLVPYNCRSFLVNGLALDVRFQGGPLYLIHRRLTSFFWPDVLKEPINALTFPHGRAKLAVKDFLVRQDLYGHLADLRRSARSFASKLGLAPGRPRRH